MARGIALEWRNEEPRGQGQSRDLPKTDAERVESKGWRGTGRRGRSRDVTLLRFFPSLRFPANCSLLPPFLIYFQTYFFIQPSSTHPASPSYFLFCAFCTLHSFIWSVFSFLHSIHSFIYSFAIIFHIIPLSLHSSVIGKNIAK